VREEPSPGNRGKTGPPRKRGNEADALVDNQYTGCPFAEKFLKSRIYFTAIYGGVSLKSAIYGGVVFGAWNAYRNPPKNATAFSNFGDKNPLFGRNSRKSF
jgi:hypothetical protein